MMADDEVNNIFAEMTADLPDPAVPVTEDFGTWEKHELIAEFRKVFREMSNPTDPDTEDDKDLQGRYYGLLLEMRRRGLKSS